ncbi:MAG: DNA repair protein RecN [Dysgonamonadaceae bacterium]|jgi:DNA repair protein RecN (Recombination protein N)|nr:DNA repair protein RecN [Dysgonamonadaceae bacterium]
MIKSLYIDHYALIDRLEINFDKGFSVITGETGAGKSIVIGALSLILGQRADAKAIRQGETKCTVEGVFDMSKYHLRPFFDERDWEFDEKECILRREIGANGKSRAFVNDSPVYLNDLKELGDKLIDIHSQHQNLSLNDNLFQLEVLDLLSETSNLKTNYSDAYNEFRKAEQGLKNLLALSQKSKEEEDYLRFQFSALSEANLQVGEQESLEAELDVLTHSEEIKSGLFKLTRTLSGDERNVEAMLKSALEGIRAIQRIFPKAEELAARVDSAYIELKDIRMEAENLFEKVDFDPVRQQELEGRLSLIYDLQKKHSLQTVGELIDLYGDLAKRLQTIDSFDEQIIALQNEVEAKRKTMLSLAADLSRKRKSAVPNIEKQLTAQLTFLSMPNAVFRCEITEKAQPDVTGTDNVQFLFSANKNGVPMPVSQIASGGEISRLMLCLKSLVAGSTALPTIIFDEIDTGTSGETADKMATMMKQISLDMQVLSITHLPQIAAKADTQYVVYKEDGNESTETRMKKLSRQERVSEIARMLSGAEITSQAVENAKAMMGAVANS